MFSRIQQNKKYIFIVFIILSIIFLLAINQTGHSQSNAQPINFTDNKLIVPHAVLTVNNKNYQHNHSYDKKIKQQPSDESEPWSNAFNFRKSMGTNVDPRTGILSAYIKAGAMLSNLGHGPNIDLEVNYSSSSQANPDGLGVGWSWNLTHFNLVTHQLITSTGHNFYLQQQSDGHWLPLYHKLKDIRIEGNAQTPFVITYANGLRETLNNTGYEVTMEQQNGWKVHFHYIGKTHLLRSVNDDMGHSIILHYIQDYITVVSKGSLGQSVPVSIFVNNNRLDYMSIHSKRTNKSTNIHIQYLGHLISEIDYPTGLKDKISYNCNGAIKVPLYNKKSPQTLCAVAKKTVIPGIGMDAIITHYQYSDTSANEHNYLGFNAVLSARVQTYKDILFKAPVNYTYQTAQDNGLIREIRTYNKYHLLIDDRQISHQSGKTLFSVHNFFCRTDQINGCAHTTFEKLPITYSLPLQIITKTWSASFDKPGITKVMATYDKLGRIVSQTDVYGRTTKTVYCSAQGDNICPAEPEEWSFNTLVKSVTLYPAKIATDTTLPPPLTTKNYYHKEKNYNGKGYINVLYQQIIQSGEQYLKTTNYYYKDADNPLTWGLLKQKVLTDNSTSSAIKRDYYYLQSDDSQRKIVQSALELKNGQRQLSSAVVSSLFTGQLLASTDPAGKNTTRYHYDAWDRPVSTDFAVGTPFAVRVHYQYTTSPTLNQVLITAPDGLQHKVIFDGMGRQLMDFDEAIDATGEAKPSVWQLKKKTTYDQYGRIKAQYAYIFKSFVISRKLMITQQYDESGRAVRVYLPDGETNINLYDDASRCVVSYKKNHSGERSVISVVRTNQAYQPIKQWLLPAPSQLLPTLKYLCLYSDKQFDAKVSSITYDGFGRQILSSDPEGKVVKKTYDAIGRLTDTTDPVGNRIHQVYNLTGQVIKNEFFPVAGGHYLLSSSGYNDAGQRVWQAGEDGQRTLYTYTINGQSDTIITPEGHHFSWQYNLLGLPINKFIDGKLQWHADYDTITKRLIKKTDETSTTVYYYTQDGLLKQLVHTGKSSYPDYQLKWEYDSNRRLSSVTDISGNKTIPRYDTLGRITATDYQSVTGNNETLSAVSYDQFFRIRQLFYGSGMKRTFEYDKWGGNKGILDQISDKLVNHWRFDYDSENNITTLKQQTGQGEQAVVHYRYDTLNNLVSMSCKGSEGLPLCPRDTAFTGSGFRQAPVIVRQYYSFTPLNRIDQVKEILQTSIQQQTSIKTMHYQYTNPSVPLRLQQISTAWGQNRSVIQKLYYDKAGNMIIDGEDNHISYNAFNQITQVVNPAGKQSSYFYDSSGKEIIEKDDTHTGYLFYRRGRLINEQIITAESGSHRVGYQGVARVTDSKISEYYENSYKGNIVSIFSKAGNGEYRIKQTNLYSPYGMVWHKNQVSSELYKQTLQEFDGERTDPFTGWQFLGAGHRTYNPKQRYFVSEDPAGDGYAFGSNNPVMNTDPSGNMPHWLGSTLQWAGNISTLGLNTLHKKWANITAAAIGVGLCVVTLGASILTEGSTAMSTILAGSAVASSLPVASAVIPANKGLGIAASITGLADLVINIAAGAALAFFGTAAAESMEGTAAEMEGLIWLKGPCNMIKIVGTRKIYKVTALPEGVEASEIVPALKAHILQAGLSHYLSEGDNLVIKDAKTIIYLWKWLRMSKFKDLILCDTGTLFITSRINGKPLSLDTYSSLMHLRNESLQSSLTQQVLDAYQIALQTVLESLSDGTHTVKMNEESDPIDVYALSWIVPVGEYIVICGEDDIAGGHMTVLRRLDDAWQCCIFNLCGHIYAERSNLSAIYREYFWSYSQNEPYICFILKLRDRFIEEVIPEL